MKKINKTASISDFDGCQLPGVPKFATEPQYKHANSIITWLKRPIRTPWNIYFKRWLKKIYYTYANLVGLTSVKKEAKTFAPVSAFVEGETVRVRTREEILSTLDPFNDLKGCTFFHEMFNYCGTEQKVFKVMRYFMDERDYKFKKTRGIILLENVFCAGNSAFGKCDRCCFLFWREEWLEKI
jgi:hypothetical protein